MMFFIDEPNTYLSVNNKGKVMNEWISTFTHVLLPDELSRDAFIEGIHVKATMLDKEFQEQYRFMCPFPTVMIKPVSRFILNRIRTNWFFCFIFIRYVVNFNLAKTYLL